MTSGLPPKRSSKAPTREREVDDGVDFVKVYAVAGIVAIAIVTLVAAYILWPSASTVASFSADTLLHARAIDVAHELITEAVDREFGNGHWGELGFEGPFPAEVIREFIQEQLANQRDGTDTTPDDPELTPVDPNLLRQDPGSCVARILVNVRQTSGKRPGRSYRLYWVNSDSTLRYVAPDDPDFIPIMTAFAKAISASKQK